MLSSYGQHIVLKYIYESMLGNANRTQQKVFDCHYKITDKY